MKVFGKVRKGWQVSFTDADGARVLVDFWDVDIWQALSEWRDMHDDLSDRKIQHVRAIREEVGA